MAKRRKDQVSMPKIESLRLGIKMLAIIAKELDKGGTLVFRNKDGTEREIKIPQLGLGRK
jgi:hypothetical protein